MRIREEEINYGAIHWVTVELVPRVGCKTMYLKKYSRSRRRCSTKAGVNLPTTFFGGSLGMLFLSLGYLRINSSRKSTKSE